jgi:hypothetical protein
MQTKHRKTKQMHSTIKNLIGATGDWLLNKTGMDSQHTIVIHSKLKKITVNNIQSFQVTDNHKINHGYQRICAEWCLERYISPYTCRPLLFWLSQRTGTLHTTIQSINPGSPDNRERRVRTPVISHYNIHFLWTDTSVKAASQTTRFLNSHLRY